MPEALALQLPLSQEFLLQPQHAVGSSSLHSTTNCTHQALAAASYSGVATIAGLAAACPPAIGVSAGGVLRDAVVCAKRTLINVDLQQGQEAAGHGPDTEAGLGEKALLRRHIRQYAGPTTA